MEVLNYEVLKKSGYEGYILEKAPEKVMQFGEGNFLRAFVDYWFDVSNEKVGWNGKCVLVQPIKPGLADMINKQEGLYTLYLRGRENGEKVDRKRVISSVSRCLNPYEEAGFEAMMEVAVSDDLEYIVSNTTEAGIVYDPACQLSDQPANSFPGKLTQVLYERWKAGKGGLVILSCELIDNNGKELLHCVNQYIDQWDLPDDFKAYVNDQCTFCSTLVDRIVPGRIRDEEEVARLEDIIRRRSHNRTGPCPADKITDELMRLIAAHAIHGILHEIVGLLFGHADTKSCAQRLVRCAVRLQRPPNFFWPNLFSHNPSNFSNPSNLSNLSTLSNFPSRPRNLRLAALEHRACVVADRHELHAAPLPDVEVALCVATKQNPLFANLPAAFVKR